MFKNFENQKQAVNETLLILTVAYTLVLNGCIFKFYYEIIWFIRKIHIIIFQKVNVNYFSNFSICLMQYF